MVCICLGNPPETFTWEYRDKDKNYQKIGPISPLEFYREHVKPLFNMEDKVGDWPWQPLAVYFQMPVDYKEGCKIPGLACMIIKLETKQMFFPLLPLRYLMDFIKLIVSGFPLPLFRDFSNCRLAVSLIPTSSLVWGPESFPGAKTIKMFLSLVSEYLWNVPAPPPHSGDSHGREQCPILVFPVLVQVSSTASQDDQRRPSFIVLLTLS